MARSVAFFLLASMCCPINAQSWCPPGSEWLFAFSSMQANGVRHAWYDGDTVVGGLPAKRIAQDIHAFQPVFPFTSGFYTTAQPLFTTELGDMVMLWDNSSSSYDTLMWFGAGPGDHWDAPHFPAPARFDVLDTGTSVIDGIPLRYLVVEEPIVMGWQDTLRERIGFDHFYINPNETFVLDFTTTWLQCYSDDDITEFAGSMQQYPCDFTLAQSEARAWTWSVAPNPGANELLVTLPQGTAAVTLQLIDAIGRITITEPLNNGPCTVSTAGLAQGAYTCRLIGGNGSAFGAMRWIKE